MEIRSIARLNELRKLHIRDTASSKFPAAVLVIAASCCQLSDVRLERLPMPCAMAFVEHCAKMRAFHVTLNEPVPATFLAAIAERWTDLKNLVLRHAERESPTHWSDAHTAAVLCLIQQRPKLEQLVCVNGAVPHFVVIDSLLLPYTATKAVPQATSALKLLWVTRITPPALQTILQSCPMLSEFAHMAAIDNESLTALAASRVKAVSFLNTGVRSSALSGFVGLTILRLWDIGEGREDALTALAERCPGLTAIYLSFRKRPSLALFPNMLRHTPALRDLMISAPLRGEDGEPQVPGAFKSEVLDTVKALIRALCPQISSTFLCL
jgi:hypothetical protein